jgi:hypothetical protein
MGQKQQKKRVQPRRRPPGPNVFRRKVRPDRHGGGSGWFPPPPNNEQLLAETDVAIFGIRRNE